MRDKSCPKINLFGLGSKRMVSMATRSVILLKNGTTPANSIISQRLFILETKLGTKLKLRHWPFIPLSNIQTTIKFLINAQGGEWLKVSQSIYLNNQNIMFVSLLQYHV